MQEPEFTERRSEPAAPSGCLARRHGCDHEVQRRRGHARTSFRALSRGCERRHAVSGQPSSCRRSVSDETRCEAEGLYPQFRQDPTQKSYDDFKLAALNRCGQAAELLTQKASPDQAAEVKLRLSACASMWHNEQRGHVQDLAERVSTPWRRLRWSKSGTR